jgi:hypothetical protein
MPPLDEVKEDPLMHATTATHPFSARSGDLPFATDRCGTVSASVSREDAEGFSFTFQV